MVEGSREAPLELPIRERFPDPGKIRELLKRGADSRVSES